jgi:beta-ureidopropionase / N-carbamoyl-L-amino-acid hydrolase
MSGNLPRIDGERLWRSLMEMAEIGPTANGGSGRVALTDLDRQGRDRFRGWCIDAGLDLRVDRCGDMIARRPGRNADAPIVVTGSHLDTQPLGGRFDGVYGVLAGLEVIRTLNDHGIETEAGLELVNWTDEEGVRFGGGCLASAAFAGRYTVEEVLARRDPDGLSFGDELQRIGYAGDAPCGGYPVAAYFEAHIEQGPVLETEGCQVGVVLGGQGQFNFMVTVRGEEGHAGTLPMTQRRDAFVGAARMAVALSELPGEVEPPPVITTGFVRVSPNSRNTVPGTTTFSINCRHPEAATLAELERRIRDLVAGIAETAVLDVAMEKTSEAPPVTFDGGCAAAVRDAAAALGIAHRDMVSGASHDAFNLARVVPTAMIFVPCERGISHNEAENAKPEDLAAGCDVLLRAMLSRAGVA